jgi:hypothetical protein
MTINSLCIGFSLLTAFSMVNQDQDLRDHFIISARPTQTPDFEMIALDNLNAVFDRKVMVFGIPVFAYTGISDEDLVLTANVFAQWLDNDEDGTVDNREILDELAKRNSYVFIVQNQGQVNTYNFLDNHPALGGQTSTAYSLDAESIQRHWYTNSPSGDPDGTMEEPFHLISDVGYGNLYPEVFGTRRGTQIAKLTDNARGGYFERTPVEYPDGAWYTNPTKGCQYGCMVGEYFHWGMTSVLGVHVNRGDHIKDQWKLHTPDLVKSTDPKLYAVLTNPKYNLPTKYPDGSYGK